MMMEEIGNVISCSTFVNVVDVVGLGVEWMLTRLFECMHVYIYINMQLLICFGFDLFYLVESVISIDWGCLHAWNFMPENGGFIIKVRELVLNHEISYFFSSYLYNFHMTLSGLLISQVLLMLLSSNSYRHRFSVLFITFSI